MKYQNLIQSHNSQHRCAVQLSFRRQTDCRSPIPFRRGKQRREEREQHFLFPLMDLSSSRFIFIVVILIKDCRAESSLSRFPWNIESSRRNWGKRRGERRDDGWWPWVLLCPHHKFRGPSHGRKQRAGKTGMGVWIGKWSLNILVYHRWANRLVAVIFPKNATFFIKACIFGIWLFKKKKLHATVWTKCAADKRTHAWIE